MATNLINPIETRYRGRRYRSRLEARWAVFFDALKFSFDYEPEGFELPSGRYLPDFYIHTTSMWAEIKGSRPTDRELQLACELAEASGKVVMVFVGMAMPGTRKEHAGIFCMGLHGDGDRAILSACDWAMCDQCNWGTIAPWGDPEFLRCKLCYICSEKEQDGALDELCPRCLARRACRSNDTNRSAQIFSTAYAKALSARFEFGEEG